MMIVPLILVFVLSTSSAAKDEFPKDDYKTFFKDLNEALGVEQMLDTIGFYFRTYIRIGQAYTQKKFDADIKALKSKPSIFKAFHFIHKIFWVAISQSGVKIIQLLTQAQNFLLGFLRGKCDLYLGKNADLHPWNVMMNQNEQHVSFLVFVYGLGLSLILIKLLSWWNFSVYLAFGFLIYSFGGPYMVFKWLLSVTALFWFIFDSIIQFPFHTAIAILTLYAISHVGWVYSLIFGSNNNRSSGRDQYDGPSVQPEISAKDEKDFSILCSRIDGMERKTDLLNDRLEMLGKSMDRMLQNMSDDDGEDRD